MSTAATDVPAEPRRFTGDEVLRMVGVGILGEDGNGTMSPFAAHRAESSLRPS